MNKTTDELLKILISKGDMQKYIEENSNEFLKFSLCQYLNQLLTEHGLKKGKIMQTLSSNVATGIKFSLVGKICHRGMS